MHLGQILTEPGLPGLSCVHLGVNFKTILSLTRPSSNAYKNHKLLRVLVIDYMPEAIKFQ